MTAHSQRAAQQTGGHPDKQADKQPGGPLARQLVDHMGAITRERIQAVALENAARNLAAIRNGNSLRELRKQTLGHGDKAIVLAAGPSLKRQQVAKQLKAAAYRGAIIATESSMLYCLRHDIVPDLVITVDPHAKRIVRWFGDTALTQADLDADDYFTRQDMDRSFADELRANEEIIALLDRYGKRMRIAVSSSAAPEVVQRATETGMDVYWWNPMYDDPDCDDSITRQLFETNRLPCVNAGGNVGTAAWMMAHAVLGKQQVAVTGMDFGYYAETPYLNTQYYYEAVALVGEERLDEIFTHIFNPHMQQWFYTDPAYLWYRECFLQLVADAQCTTYNCTEGGILFGEHIEFAPLQKFLDRE
ncbi:MAG: motility associated factor glycosyltransferase family protein [Gammaproteobacteria bacterium]|nr:motility associated factor glycosyltransferase family protein [Gammaproteobacteria bacterium]